MMDTPLKQVTYEEIEAFVEGLVLLSMAAKKRNQHALSQSLDHAINDLVYAKYLAPKDPHGSAS